MIIECEKNDMVNSLSIAERSLPARAVSPVLSGIMITALEGQIHLTANSINMAIETVLNGEVKEEGQVVINGRLLGEIARSLPNDRISISVDEHLNTTIKCGPSEISIKGMSPDEFPEIPFIENGIFMNVSSQMFRNMIRQTAFAVSVDETKGILTGELLKINGDLLTLAAVDGYRVAVRFGKLTDNTSDRHMDVVIPGRSLTELMRILPQDEQPFLLVIDDKYASFKIDGTTIVTQLLEGKFINYDDIIQSEISETKTTVKVKTAELLSAVDRAMLMAKEGKASFIKLSISNQDMVITSNTDIGKTREEINAEIDGVGVEIAFNGKYLSDPLKVIDDEELLLKFNTNISPCIMEPVDGNDYLYLILPVRTLT